MSDSEQTGDLSQYHQRRRVWAGKPQIRLVYKRWIEKIKPWMPSGSVVEVGSGSGHIKELLPDILLTDLATLPWIDQIVDCMNMPFDDESIDGILSIDLLHHAGDPHAFLREAARVLKPGGKAIFIEPYITPFSSLMYRTMHHEDVCLTDYHRDSGKQSEPWEGNLGLANLVFKRDLENWKELQPNLQIAHRELGSFIDFQIAAGFKPYAFAPHWLFKHLVRIDDWLSFAMPLIGFRILVVLEKV